jgi:hypothetical protein
LPLFAGLLISNLAEAKYDVNRPLPSPQSNVGRVSAQLCLVSSSRSELDINNVRTTVLNGGDMWWDLNSNPRYEVPKVTEANQPRRHSIFAGSLWIGGLDANGQLHVAAQTYRQGGDVGFWPGPLDDQGTTDRDVCSAWNSHAKINRSAIDAFRANPPRNAQAIPPAIRDWPGRNNPYLNRPRLNQELAPFVDVNKDGNYDPLTGDYPDIRGDQAIWWAINDAGAAKDPFTPPIGLELNIMAFAFSTSDLINNMTFYQQRVINKGQKTLNKAYIGQWVDADLGYFNDDYVGCDVSRGLGFCYNGDNFDEGVSGYGLNPPTVAVDFFEGPLADANDGVDNDRDSYSSGIFNPALVDEPREKIIMSNFVYYNNDFSANGNPTAAQHYYNYLRSKITTGQDLNFGGNGLTNTNGRPYAFMFPAGGGQMSDPYGFGYNNPPIAGEVPSFDWSEAKPVETTTQPNVPSDRRFLQSAGPFTLRPGAVNRVTIGIIWGSAGVGGPQGSNGLVTFADDQAQALFDRDFELSPTPPPPTVEVTQLDQQLVLSIKPGVVALRDGRIIQTETFAEQDTSLPAAVKDQFFRFEGYLIYELKNNRVSASEVFDQEKSKLIARYDLVNGVGQIINYDFSPEIGNVVPKVAVDGKDADAGIFHTVDIKNTAFSTSADARLANFKRYYYAVVPYAYNADKTTNASGIPLVIAPFRPGKPLITSAIPSKPVVLNGGTVLNSKAFDNVKIKRVNGIGSGGAVLEIDPADESEIVASGGKQDLHYKAENAPISVRVYNPLAVRKESFSVRITSTISYLKSTAVGQIQEGDLLISTGQYDVAETSGGSTSKYITTSTGPQIPGRAIARKLLREEPVLVDSVSDVLVTWDIEMLNDDQGGTFTANVADYSKSGTDSTLVGFEDEPRGFVTSDRAFGARAQKFALFDAWKWKTSSNPTWNYALRPVSEINEELIPEYGISIQVRPGRTPGYQARFNPQGQFKEATLTQGLPAWLTGVPNEIGPLNTTFLGIQWLQTDETTPNTKAWDPGGQYSRLLPIGNAGTFAAYANSRAIGSDGAAYVNPPAQRLFNLRSVDVVLTADKSKWTRVPVLQINSSQPAFALTKRGSTKPDGSIAPSGQPSTGMGWFPGYAIDKDRGIRLNMAFAENSAAPRLGGQGPDLGADLIWGPGSFDPFRDTITAKYAGRNFIYISDTKYDEGREMERRQDSLATVSPGPARPLFKKLYDQFMYVGYPRLIPGQKLLQSDARIRIRVGRNFTSYPATTDNTAKNPEYSFSLEGREAVSNQRDVACKALDLIRVVPNPYYAFSTYEDGQITTFSRITNLPQKAQITIYTLNGTLVKRISKANNDTFTDFNMRNDSGLPIASGVYLFHVKDLNTGCEEIVRWMCIMRPVDLDTF